MHFPGLSGFQDHGQRSPFFRFYQMLVNGRNRKKRRHGNTVLIHSTVCQDQDIGSVTVSLIHFYKETLNGTFQLGAFIISDGNLRHTEAFHMHMLDLQHVRIGQDRVIHLQNLTVFRLLFQKVAVFSHINGGTGDDLLTDRIDWRVGNLCKKLFEIIKKRTVLFGKHSQRGIHTHGSRSFAAVQRHLQNGFPVLLIGIAKGLLQPCPLFIGKLFHLDVRDLQVMKLYQVAVQPFAVRLFFRIVFFQLFILKDLMLHRIHKKHFSGMQTLL